jgi:hypothetical protein
MIPHLFQQSPKGNATLVTINLPAYCCRHGRSINRRKETVETAADVEFRIATHNFLDFLKDVLVDTQASYLLHHNTEPSV